ncbi:family 20 glycosylhydrolase [Chitinophaga agrisoli]|uniref:beta-N-acetylhexosaminidase n=2 Tax=Chitinophaga agrisoli TaxID=2607653 RepID=A0A5B2VQG6_9BACT|nr:family 20 glycosylhydrolase [Chitinophaga agrisoli]
MFACALLAQLFSFHVTTAQSRVHIIPEPAEITENPGEFMLDNNTALIVTGAEKDDKDLAGTVQWFTDKIAASTGYRLQQKKEAAKSIRLEIVVNQARNRLQKEGYALEVTPTQVVIRANMAQGIFYGLQSLLQLLPPDIEADKTVTGNWPIPCVNIVDYPRFGWRGLMLDVSRHFFTKDEVKRYIDEMAKYKYNTFHWHLSDDNGWRIEIKAFPELTQKGAWRVERVGRWGTFLPPQPGEATPYGGFYTQDDIREIIKYAQDRYITILPEIDVPAHSLSMITAMPNLSCTQLQYAVGPGDSLRRKNDNVLCIGNDSVYAVLDKVFTEIAALFPNPYIHIGGDEAFKGFWSNCPKCRKRMDKEHLKDVNELQSYFVKRMEKMLNSKGKKLIGWDEILEGGLAPEATVMSWRGMKGGIEAARMNHHVVMTPWDFCYLDLYQGETAAEPPTYGICRLSDSYNYDPVPDSVDEKFILGGQGNLWTESVNTLRHAEYMTWPRSLALAEVYWSPKAKRNWDDFITRMEAQYPRLDAAGVKYARSAYNAIATPGRDGNGALTVRLSTEIKGLDIYYTFDNSDPDQFYPQYQSGQQLTFPKGAAQITVVTYRDGKKIGDQFAITKEDLEKRLTQGRHIY